MDTDRFPPIERYHCAGCGADCAPEDTEIQLKDGRGVCKRCFARTLTDWLLKR